MSKPCVCSISISDSDSNANTWEQNNDQIDRMIHACSIIQTNSALRKKNDLPHAAHVEINVTFDSILFIFSRKVNHRRYFAESSMNENDLSVLCCKFVDTHVAHSNQSVHNAQRTQRENVSECDAVDVCGSSSNRQISHCAMSAPLCLFASLLHDTPSLSFIELRRCLFEFMVFSSGGTRSSLRYNAILTTILLIMMK